MADFSFPNFGVPFPYANLPQQLQASFVPPAQQFSNGSQYGRFNGVNNNAFGLFPSQWPSVFGSPVAPPMSFQPPYGNNGTLGSNQGPGSNPNGPAPATPAQVGQPPMPTGDNFNTPIPKSAPANPGLLNMNVAPNQGQIQSTQGLGANQGAQFGFNIPTGYSTNGGVASFSVSPTGDDAMAQRNLSVGGMSRTGIEPSMYFAVGGPALDRWGRVDPSIPVLQPGQNVANVSGGLYGTGGMQGPANLDYSLSLPQHAQAPMNPFLQAQQAFLARNPGFQGNLTMGARQLGQG